MPVISWYCLALLVSVAATKLLQVGSSGMEVFGRPRWANSCSVGCCRRKKLSLRWSGSSPFEALPAPLKCEMPMQASELTPLQSRQHAPQPFHRPAQHVLYACSIAPINIYRVQLSYLQYSDKYPPGLISSTPSSLLLCSWRRMAPKRRTARPSLRKTLGLPGVPCSRWSQPND